MLTTIGWMATLHAWKQSRQRQQAAWQWWHHRQTFQSNQTAESIRDGLLQQTFAFRRYLEKQALESSTPTDIDADAEKASQWLHHFQNFHHSLETLSDQLSPPFVADSLPHALQFILRNGQQPAALPPVKLDLPTSWNQSQSTPQQNQTVLSVLSTLLSLLLPENHSATQISVWLSQSDAVNVLVLKVKYSEQPLIHNKAELQYLKEIFHSLTAGQLEIAHETLSIRICLSWQNSSSED